MRTRTLAFPLLGSFLLAAPLLASCTVHVDLTPLPEPPLAAGCNPLGGGEKEDCVTPFPSNYYRSPDDKGVMRISFPPGVLPASAKGVALDPALLLGRDGFSPAVQLVAYFPVAIDGSNLPAPRHEEDSIKVSSPVHLFDFETGQRIPLFAELDRNATDGDRQALLVVGSSHDELQSHRVAVCIDGHDPTHAEPPARLGRDAARFVALNRRVGEDGGAAGRVVCGGWVAPPPSACHDGAPYRVGFSWPRVLIPTPAGAATCLLHNLHLRGTSALFPDLFDLVADPHDGAGRSLDALPKRYLVRL
ncbi:MAG TPA: hypothetical protein PKW11_11955, partial [Pseudomonadota bacterium]|nr:hypothetical protein [Pseudomonadota bacterium]